MELIKGEEIFYDFRELDYTDPNLEKDVISKIHSWDMQGVVVKNVFTQEEVDDILSKMDLYPKDLKLETYTGQSFPDPFATITNAGERLDNYIHKTDVFLDLPFETLLNRLSEFFNRISHSITPGVPEIKDRDKKASPGNFRILPADKGGLFVHCGYLFQVESPFYYKVVDDMIGDGQLSYFVVLQNADEGGELTLYDMLWKDIKDKDDFNENRYVLKPDGTKLYLDDVRRFYVRPNPGDIVVFAGGPIWHRVEPVKGKPRITFGGFANFSEDAKRFYYWS